MILAFKLRLSHIGTKTVIFGANSLIMGMACYGGAFFISSRGLRPMLFICPSGKKSVFSEVFLVFV